MAKITTITNPLTGQPVQVDQLDHTAQQIDEGISIARVVSNPNLLDNWYFWNPVNQRGITTTTSNDEYFIDRWMSRLPGASVSNGAIKIAHTNGIQQILEDVLVDYIIGKECTISAIVDGVMHSATVVLSGSYMAFNLGYSGIRMDLNLTAAKLVLFYNNSGEYRTLSAVKLELGSQQTLAHQDENGNWVLNEIPDYGEQLRKCQRYFVRYIGSKTSTANIGSGVAYSDTIFTCVLPLPVPMRTMPIFSMYGMHVSNERSLLPVSNVVVNNMVTNAVSLEITTQNLTMGYPYFIKLGGEGGYIDLSADL